jgi:integrase
MTAEALAALAPTWTSSLRIQTAARCGPTRFSASISLLCRRLKLPPGASLHTLRHTHATHMLVGGVPLQVVSERLGHSSVRVTAEVYAHSLRGQDDEAVRKLEEFQRASRSAARAPAVGQVH